VVRPERNFYQQLKRNVEIPGRHLQRIETSVTAGVPDLNYCFSGDEGWAELKAWEIVKTAGDRPFVVPKLRPEQAAWLYRRRLSGGRAFLLFRINEDVVLIDGVHAPSIMARSYSWNRAREVAECWLTRPLRWELLVVCMRKNLAALTGRDSIL
jgi:hypothetical protein